MIKLFMLMSFFFISACVNFGRPSKVEPGRYLVKPSDTLYSVAWRYNLNFKTLAAWNKINSPYTIRPGQHIYLIKPKNYYVQETISSKKAVKISNLTKRVKKTNNKPLVWEWPTKGKVLNMFSLSDINKRGIDIASKVRQPVVAVSAGKVVYSGNGLDGYKNLIIIKHNETYLSAYAQNKNLLVKEGDLVKKGKIIADMGMDKKHSFLLHFQIRKQGKPVDPMLYLP